jgi:disulfide bond formation protein DsbB
MFARRGPAKEETSGAVGPELVYQAVAQRRLQHDILMWPVPALGLTAQAFLLTIALGSGSSRVARILAALLAAISTGLSMQLMARHRWHEATERAWLEAFERRHGLDPVHRVQYELAPEVGVRPANRIAAWCSYRTWQLGLAVFGLVSLLSLALAIFTPDVLVL